MLRRLLRRSDVLLSYNKYRESRHTAFGRVNEAGSTSLDSLGHAQFGSWAQLGNGGLERVEEYLLFDEHVPVGSELSANLGSEQIDLRCINGDEDRLKVKLQSHEKPGNQMNNGFVSIKQLREEGQIGHLYEMRVTDCNLDPRLHSLLVEIPSRYFSVEIHTAGNISIENVKEARMTKVETSHGDITYGSISSENVELIAHKGRIHGKQILSNNCNITASEDIPVQDDVQGKPRNAVQGKKLASKQAKISGGMHNVCIESVIGCQVDLTGGNIEVQSLNTILEEEEESEARIHQSRTNSFVRVGGIDGYLTVHPSLNSMIDVQLSNAAKRVAITGAPLAKARFHIPPSLEVCVTARDTQPISLHPQMTIINKDIGMKNELSSSEGISSFKILNLGHNSEPRSNSEKGTPSGNDAAQVEVQSLSGAEFTRRSWIESMLASQRDPS